MRIPCLLFAQEQPEFTHDQWDFLERGAARRLVEKLKKTVAADYDAVYQEQYANKRMSVKEKYSRSGKKAAGGRTGICFHLIGRRACFVTQH